MRSTAIVVLLQNAQEVTPPAPPSPDFPVCAHMTVAKRYTTMITVAPTYQASTTLTAC